MHGFYALSLKYIRSIASKSEQVNPFLHFYKQKEWKTNMFYDRIKQKTARKHGFLSYLRFRKKNINAITAIATITAITIPHTAPALSDISEPFALSVI